MMASQCLDELAVLRLESGELTAGELATVEVHLDDCEACRRLVATVARSEPDAEPVDTIEAGRSIGRYVLLTPVGSGGMGTVFAAWDPELDRKVAIKVVNESAATSASAQERLMEEARTLASLRHPNVISIYDVGRVGDRVFIAMDYMEGGTLGAWMVGGLHPWREVVRRFVEAGRGLVAAHAAGLVHRDFKPANVLLTRDDHCVVTDFGLASASFIEPATIPEAMARSTAWGTPAYAPPEVVSRSKISPAADQFSFCVALHEALYGLTPFAGDTVESRFKALRDGMRRELPSKSSVPGPLRRVVQRGLALAPEDRFPSMEALLEALEAAASRRRLWTWGATGAALVALAFAVTPTGETECDGGLGEWKTVWGDAAKGDLSAAFVDSGAPGADQTWVRFAAALDDYVAQWSDAHRQACEAAKGDAAQRADAVAVTRCLGGDRLRAFALLDALDAPRPETVERSLTAVASLPLPRHCVAGASPLQTETTDPATQQALLEELASIDTVWRLHEPELVRPRLDDLEARATAAGLDGIVAGVAVQRGRLLVDAANHADARETFVDAGFRATAAGMPDVAAEAWISLMALDGAESQRFDWAEHWEGLASAQLRQVGEGTRFHAMFSAHQGLVRANRGDWEGSRDAWREAVRVGSEALGEAHPDVVAFRVRLGEALALTRDVEGAKAEHARALEQHLQLYGEQHRETARTLRAIAHTLVQQGRPKDAIEYQQRCLDIQRAVLPARHREIGYTLGNMGITVMAADSSRGEEALRLMRQGLAIMW